MWISISVIATITVALTACQQKSPPPNVILISIDTLRADHLGCYGHGEGTSPFLDSLARSGVRFEHAFAQSSWTLPSHMSLMTSRYPHTHQVQNEDRRLPPGVSTLAQTLQDNGYQTAGVVRWFLVSSAFGFDRGFEHYEELLAPQDQFDPSLGHSIKADEFVEHVIANNTFDLDRPFFLFLHLFDPHINYEPPLEHARVFDPEISDLTPGTYGSLKRYIPGLSVDAERIPASELEDARTLYKGEIHFVDSALERLFAHLEERSMLDDTVIVITSDHGEELDDHGSMEGHQWTLFDEVIRVPLLMVFPGHEHAGTEIPRLVQSIDIAPTLLSYLGMQSPADFQGRNLMPLVRGEPFAGDELVFSQHQRGNSKIAIRSPKYKLIFTEDTGTNSFGVPIEPGVEFYDLEADPNEQDDIFAMESPEAQRLLRRLIEWQTGRPLEEAAPGPEISPEDRERLRALGYGGGD